MTVFDSTDVYSACAMRVVDGSTVKLKLDLGFGIRRVVDMELYDIPQSESEVAREFVRRWLTKAEIGQSEWPLKVEVHDDDCVTVLRRYDDRILNDDLRRVFGP